MSDELQQLIWQLDAPAQANIDLLAARLAECREVYRHPRTRGLVIGTRDCHIEITTAADLQAVVYDRLDVIVCKSDKKTGELVPTGRLIPGGHLSVLLRSLRCLSLFRPFPDLVAEAVVELGAARPETWLTPAEWVVVADETGLSSRLRLPAADGSPLREAERGRQMGIRLSAYVGETLATEIDGETVCLRLEHRRMREYAQIEGNAANVYRFAVVDDDRDPPKRKRKAAKLHS